MSDDTQLPTIAWRMGKNSYFDAASKSFRSPRMKTFEISGTLIHRGGAYYDLIDIPAAKRLARRAHRKAKMRMTNRR